MIADIKVNNDNWVPEYAASVHDIVHKHGGKYLARSANITTLEGNPSNATIIALLEFPTMDALNAFIEDPEYKPYADARAAGTQSNFESIDGTDAAGTIDYLSSSG